MNVLIVINGENEERQFHLPVQQIWSSAWCSTQVNGQSPRCDDEGDSGSALWTFPAFSISLMRQQN